MGSRCAKCGEPTDPWVDGDGGDERCRCTPTPPAAAANRTTPPVEGTSGQGGAAVTDAGFDSPGGSARAAVASGAEMREACAKACLSRAELLREKSADFLKRAGGSHGLTEARECREAAERRLQDALLCESLAASLRALPLPPATGDATRVPARDDAVEEAARALSDSVHAYYGDGDYLKRSAEIDIIAKNRALRAALAAADASASPRVRREKGGA